MGSLYAAISAAQAALDTNQLGHLPLPNRKSIWLELGPTMTHVIPPLTDGVLRRGALAILTVRRVLPVWDTAMRTPEVENVLVAGQRFVRQEIAREDFSRTLDRLSTRADNVAGRGEQFFRASYVARATTTALGIFINDFHYPRDDDRSQDEDLDPYDWDDWDASLYACMALTDDVWAKPPVHVEERRAFWKWYIQEATPEAYDNFSAILGLK